MEQFHALQQWADLTVTIAQELSAIPDRAAAIAKRLDAVAQPKGDGQRSDDRASLDQLQADTAPAFLLAQAGADASEAAGHVADLLARVPLALTLAGRYIAAVGDIDLAGYRDRYVAAAPRLWDTGVAPGCPEAVARACLLGVERLAATCPAGLELVELCAFVDGDADIPLAWLLAPDSLLPPELRAAVDSEQGSVDAVAAPTELGLITWAGRGVRMDPLIQTVLRQQLGEAAHGRCVQAATLVLAAFPWLDINHGLQSDDAPRAAALLPHLVRLGTTVSEIQPVLSSIILERIALYQEGQQALPDAEAAAARALAIRESMLPPEAPQIVEMRDLLARIEREAAASAGEIPGQDVREALERALQDAEGDPQGQLAVLDQLTTHEAEQGNLPGAIAAHRMAFAIRERLFGPDDPELLQDLAALATLLQHEGDPAQARVVLERALDIHETSFNPDHPRDWIARGLLTVLIELGDGAAVRTAVERLLDLYAPHVGFRHAELAGFLHELVDLLIAHREFAHAEVALARIADAEAADGAYGPKHPKVFDSLARLAQVQQRQGKREAAVTTLERLVEAKAQRYGDKHEAVATVLVDLAGAKVECGDLPDALPLLERAIGIYERVYGRDHQKTASFATDVALVVVRAGDLQRAKVLLEQAVGLCGLAYGDTHDETVRAADALAGVVEELGEPVPTREVPLFASERLGVADLERFEPGWIERTPSEQLPTIATQLSRLADELEQAEQREQALQAASEALQALQWMLEHTPADEFMQGEHAQALGMLFQQKARLLAELGRYQEIMQISEEMGAFGGQLDTWQEQKREESERRSAELERSLAVQQRRADISITLFEQRALVDRRRTSIVRRMSGVRTSGYITLDVQVARIEAAFNSSPTVVVIGDPELSRDGLDGSGTSRMAQAYAQRRPAGLTWRVDAATRLTTLQDLARLAEHLELEVSYPAELAAMADATVNALIRRGDWLLVFDNAVYSDYLERIARLGTGRVLITTADPAVTPLGSPVAVDVIDTESASQQLVAAGGIEADGALRLAERLGGLPLAVELACAYLRDVDDLDAAGYIACLDDAQERLWSPDLPAGQLRPAVLACLVALERLAAISPAGLELLQIAAFLDAHADLPLDRLTAALDLLPERLRDAATADVGLAEPLDALSRLGLMTRDGLDGRLPGLVAAVVRQRLAPEPAHAWHVHAAMLVLAGFPSMSGNVGMEFEDLRQAARMAPHAVELADRPTLGDRVLAIMLLDHAGRYLARRGEIAAAITLLQRSQRLRDETFPANDYESAEALTHLVTLQRRSGDRTPATELLERRLVASVESQDVDALHKIATSLADGGDRAAARSVLERELAIREQVNGPDSAEVAALLRQLATAFYWHDKQYKQAVSALERAALIVEALEGPDTLGLDFVLSDLATILRDQGDARAARPVIQRRLRILEGAHGPQSAIAAQCLEQLAAVDEALGDPDSASAALTRALEIHERYGPGTDADRVRHSLVNLLVESGDAIAVRATYEGLITSRQQAAEDAGTQDAGTVAPLLRELVSVARTMGDLSTARSAQERIVDVYAQTLGSDAPELASAAGDLAIILAEVGDGPAARAAAQRAVSIDERLGDGAVVALARHLTILGAVLRHVNDLPAARTALERAVDVTAQAFGAHHIAVGHSLVRLGEVLRDVGDVQGARAAQERALDIHGRLLGSDHPETLHVLTQLEALDH